MFSNIGIALCPFGGSQIATKNVKFRHNVALKVCRISN